MAAADTVFSPALTDRLFNYVIAVTAVAIGGSCWIAVRRRSRVVWFYLTGWSPVIIAILARLARNLGLMPQIDGVDMATFAALAFEALLQSLAIADRFRLVRQELDTARQRPEIDRAEASAIQLAARTDHLTGIGNRSAFQADARAMMARGDAFSRFLIDVDYLKDSNDRLGHRGGDALLQRVATSLQDLSSGTLGIMVARIGGDEFALPCPDGRNDEARLVDLLATIQSAPRRFMEHDRAISLSIGSVCFPEDADELDALYHNADLALYTAKRQGRACHYHYSALRDHGDAIPLLSANFTASQLSGPRSANRILDRLVYYGLSPSPLCIDVTDGVMLGRTVGELRSSGSAGRSNRAVTISMEKS